jgi:hypothetical protein
MNGDIFLMNGDVVLMNGDVFLMNDDVFLMGGLSLLHVRIVVGSWVDYRRKFGGFCKV